jgi:zinc finger SWIM domain-containing protein 3
VLGSFLEAMGNRQPKAVMTDGDLAMRETVRVVFPETCHRLCAWHLNKNAYENVKNKDFLTNFNKAMYSNFTVEEFEEFWANLVETNGLQGHTWVSKTYENKKLWATAYFQDMFFGRIRTTSQCEAINSMMKRYVRKKCSIYEFMHKFDQALREYRNNEHVADFQSYSSDPVLTTGLNSIEKDASKIYTLEMFKEVKKQIVKSSALIVSEREEVEDKLLFKLTKTCDTKYEKEVFYDTANSSFYCQCRLFEARGIPCSHIIFVMKEEHVDHIPSGLILKRWTKNAKNRIMAPNVGKGLDSNLTDVDRCGAYSAACNRFCKVAAESGACFNDVMDDILKLTEKYSNLKLRGSVRTQNSEMDKHIGDPDAVNSKGAPKKKIRLKRPKHRSKCTDTKHDVRTCPIRIDVNGSLIDNDKDAAKFSKATCKSVSLSRDGCKHNQLWAADPTWFLFF